MPGGPQQRCNRGNPAYSRPSLPRRFPYDRVLLPVTPSCPRDRAQFLVNMTPSRSAPLSLTQGHAPSSRASLSLCPVLLTPRLLVQHACLRVIANCFLDATFREWGVCEFSGLRKATRNSLHSHTDVSRIAARITVPIPLVFQYARLS